MHPRWLFIATGTCIGLSYALFASAVEGLGGAIGSVIGYKTSEEVGLTARRANVMFILRSLSGPALGYSIYIAGNYLLTFELDW